MSRDQFRAGLIAGVVAAAATAGAMLGVGLRMHTPARPFNAIASHLIGPDAILVWAFHPIVTPVGIVLHVAFCCICGVAFVAATAHTTRPRWMVAVAVAFCAMIISLASARLMGTGLAVLLPFGDLLVCDVALAVALALGIRLAPPVRASLPATINSVQ